MSCKSDQSELYEHYRDVVQKMMYYNGDLEHPIPYCVDMVLDLAKFQMVKVLEDAWHRVCTQKRKEITLEDVLFLFGRNKFMLKRLLHFAKCAEYINRHIWRGHCWKDKDSDEYSDDKGDKVRTSYISNSILTRMEDFVNSLGMVETAGDLLELFDSELYERQRRIANTVKYELSGEEYRRFRGASKASFLDGKRFKKKHGHGDLLCWLGAPQCEPVVSFVLAFIGREVVAAYVDAAVTVMKTEEPNLYLCDTKDGFTADPNEDCPLQIRHYTEALRRCEGWRRHRDFLFGYHENNEDNDFQESAR